MDAVLAPLHAELDALDAALSTVSGEDCAALLGQYDANLRKAMDVHGAILGADALQGLLQHQHDLSARMRLLRDEAASHLQQGRTSLRAAHAYLQAESLA